MGDHVYGPGFNTKARQTLAPPRQIALEGLGRQALHAYLLAIEHPTGGEILEFRFGTAGRFACLRHSLGAQGTVG